MSSHHTDAHPRFAEALRELGLEVPVFFPLDPKTLIAHAGGTLVDVRERTA
ncbi:hypothetical protein AB0D12_16370 [Streptomyces sp. NPDC048479]|uniref:hypothetical protein n=1 Tax=Streptomyces sp. NPDC048479 TaxID=3154725 RepID=UPI0034134ECA